MKYFESGCTECSLVPDIATHEMIEYMWFLYYAVEAHKEEVHNMFQCIGRGSRHSCATSVSQERWLLYNRKM